MIVWRFKRSGLLLATLILALSSLTVPAHAADWRRAESDRFIVYSDGGERALTDYVQKLETFDRILRYRMGLSIEEAPPRKLPIYLVGGRSGLVNIYQQAPANVVGVYLPTGEDIFAVAMRNIDDDDILFHEYVHHFMLQNFPNGYPGWFVEGFAEYYMTAKVKDRSVEVGMYNANRAYWLTNGNWIPLEDLLSKRPGDISRSSHRETYYPVAWLLTHWFIGNAERRPQLDTYLSDVSAGGDPVEAMRRATGLDLTQLRNALRQYTRERIPYQKIMVDFPEVPVTVTRLPDSADDLLLLSQRLKIGVPDKDKAATAQDVRRAAARHPDDPFAMLTLGHAELHFGDRAAGFAVLERLLVLEPDNVEALQFMASGRMAEADDRPDEADRLNGQARAFLARAYKAEPANYYTLYLIAKTREGAANYPNENDLTTWLTALELAPQWSPIRLGAASALIQADEDEAAIAILSMLANGPHAGASAQAAQAMIELAKAGEAPPSLDTIEAETAEIEPQVGPETEPATPQAEPTDAPEQ